MRRAAILLLFIFMAASAHAQSRRRAVSSGDDLFDANARILWIGAHPDDESLLAPLLGTACAERGAHCSLLVLTRGEHGPCALPGGCGDDLGAIRATELSAAANLLHASFALWSHADVMENVRGTWPASIVDDIAAVVGRFAPTVVITFDPRHGSSCHPAHRAAAELAIEALARFENPPPLLFVEAVNRDLTLDNATPGAAGLRTFDDGWHYLLDDLAAHRSQFTDEQRAIVAATPPERQRVWLLDAKWAPFATYVYGCP
ncbi:MAG TPA: PIG-L family deacetylase [Thermoanaerobaculia bacterium]|nr:PIG-L family deacetylase [Thermoanaerobaculia bacterium]